MDVPSLQKMIARRIMEKEIQHMRAAYQAALEATRKELLEERRLNLHLEREIQVYENFGFECGRCGAVHGY